MKSFGFWPVVLFPWLVLAVVFFYSQKQKHAEAVRVMENVYHAEVLKSRDLAEQLDISAATTRDLQAVLEAKNQEIATLTKTVLDWKGKYFQIKNARQTTISKDDQQTSPTCQACLDNVRMKVEFDEKKDYLKVQGFTLTNPAYAEIGVEWIKPLQLAVALTKDSEGKFNAYLVSDNSDFIPTQIDVSVDDSVLYGSWYEKISFGADLVLDPSDPGMLFSVKYDFGNFGLGPNVRFSKALDKIIESRYGVSMTYYPWR